MSPLGYTPGPEHTLSLASSGGDSERLQGGWEDGCSPPAVHHLLFLVIPIPDKFLCRK